MIKNYIRFISNLLAVLVMTGFSFSLLSAPKNPLPLTRAQGIQYLYNFSRKDYRNQSQNWAILQDKRGFIYIANQGMLMEFDGVSWVEINIPNKTVRSLAINEDDGTIYVGGKDEIGFLTPDQKGKLHYQSLISHLDEKYRNFSNVWRAYWTKEGVYFWTLKYLFRWNRGRFKIWESDKVFDACFVILGKVYIRERDSGILEMKEDRLELIHGGYQFSAKEKNLYMMAPYDSQRLLIGTRQQGLFLYQKNAPNPFTPFPTEADDYLYQKGLYYGIVLTDGNFALATREGGLIIMDRQGKVRQIFNKASGLQDNSVKYVLEDNAGNIWLALEEGIAKIEYASPISVFNEDNSGLSGKVLSVQRHGHNNRLFAGTTRGLFYLSFIPSEFSYRFDPIPGISTCWSLHSTGETLLAATDQGVFQIGPHNNKKIISQQSFFLYPSHKNKELVWVGTYQGIVGLINDKGQWEEYRRIDNLSPEIRTITEDYRGNIWIGTITQGVLKLEVPLASPDLPINVKRYQSNYGLPPEEISVYWAAHHVIFATGKGLYRYDEEKDMFIPDNILGDKFAGGKGGSSVFRLAEDSQGNIWFHSHSRNLQARLQNDGTYTINKKPFLRIPLAQINEIYPDPGADIIWFAGQDGLIRFDRNKKKNYNRKYSVYIRRVLIKGQEIFWGNTLENRQKEMESSYRVPFRNRSLRFIYAAPFYQAESETLYRYFLEGNDDKWSGWSKETQKDYTNLVPGEYTFRVKAKNIYDNISSEDTFKFKVLPPWYGSWWSYLLYAFTGLALLFFIVRWRSHQLLHEKQKLEHTIKERTIEIQNKNKQLEEQAQQLKEIDRMKSRFFANISHEFRTPLTLIMGPIQQMLSGTVKNKKEQELKLRMMLRNSQRLLELINQLLDLSRLDSGKVKLQAVQQDINTFIKGITASFENAAQQRELDLIFQSDETEILVFFDPVQLEVALVNIISNALKFTPPGGKITVKVKRTTKNSQISSAQTVEISVCDTGPGIAADHLNQIFDRFFQASASHEHHAKGSGIGLAVSKEIVEMHYGTIEVYSNDSEPCGSKFVIRLPLGSAHLQPSEISSIPQTIKKSLPTTSPRIALPVPEEESIEETDPLLDETDVADEVLKEKDIILVVEDSSDMRTYIRSSLQPFYRIEEAGDGKQGIEQAFAIIPDLIISDVMMPELDGNELCRILKNDIRTSHIPIILLTAKASEEGILNGLRTGADDYITKPFSTAILQVRIQNLIDIRQHLQQTWNREMTLQPTEFATSTVDKEFIADLRKVIEKNIAEPDFNVEQLSKRLYMSHATLYRKINALTGESPTDFLRSYRLKRGAQLLKKGTESILEVALEVGFSSANYFSKCFKKKFQRLPSEYRTAQRNQESKDSYD